ncbi:MAG: hypothetical protein INQ03_02620 [Candidatus Heimdallarchaeota archaeon]|nr:hypothetical protein [Candidatus Heimdallarchaeota archaeon]
MIVRFALYPLLVVFKWKLKLNWRSVILPIAVLESLVLLFLDSLEDEEIYTQIFFVTSSLLLIQSFLFTTREIIGENRYILEIQQESEYSYIQVAELRLDVIHYSRYEFEPLTMKKEGKLSRYDSTEELKIQLMEYFKDFQEQKLEVLITRTTKRGIYSRYKIYLFAINTSRSSSIEALDALELKYPSIQKLEVNTKAFRRNLYLNNSRIYLDPTGISTDYKGIELANHELEILAEIVEDIRPITSYNPPCGNLPFGKSVYNDSISINTPDSVIYVGSADHIDDLFANFDDITLISDNPMVIDAMIERFEDIQILELEDLSIDVIALGVEYPAFLRKLFTLLEEILSSTIKKEYTSRMASGKIIEFINMKFIYHIEKQLYLRDLLSPSTYRTYSNPITDDVYAKFEHVFNLELFNSNNQCLLEFIRSRGRKLISVEQLDETALTTLLILMLVLQDQVLNHQMIMMSYKHVNEDHLKKLVETLDLNKVFIHLNTIGHYPSWITQFDLVLYDSKVGSEKFKEAVFHQLPDVRSGIYLKQDFREMTILELGL